MKYHASGGRVLTPGQIARLDEIEADVADSIDFTPAPEANWAAAARGKHARVAPGAISICLDPDVRAWLRAKGLDPAAEINRILREMMLAPG